MNTQIMVRKHKETNRALITTRSLEFWSMDKPSSTATSSIIIRAQYERRKQCPEISKPFQIPLCWWHSCLLVNSRRGSLTLPEAEHAPVRFSMYMKTLVQTYQTAVPTSSVLRRCSTVKMLFMRPYRSLLLANW